MASFALFRLCRKFSDCYLAVDHRLYRVDLRKLHYCGDLLHVFHHRLELLLCYSGQFSNIEESKFTMLDNSEDFDTVMAEADERERVARAVRSAEQPNARPAATMEATVPSVPIEHGQIT